MDRFFRTRINTDEHRFKDCFYVKMAFSLILDIRADLCKSVSHFLFKGVNQ